MAALVRPRDGRILADVCAGIADHYGWSRGMSPAEVRCGLTQERRGELTPHRVCRPWLHPSMSKEERMSASVIGVDPVGP